MDHDVISISREFGSGGRLIGKRLAARLQIPCYDRTLIQKTAEKSGLSPEFIARAEERARSRFHMSFAPMPAGISALADQGVPVSHQAFFAQAEVIRELAEEGPCVIVGRCSDYILEGCPRCFKIFIHSDIVSRAARCERDYQLQTEDIERYIAQMDRGRANYYNYFTGRTWGDMRRYDLTLDSGVTGVDGAVEIIAELVRIGRTGGAR